MVPRMNKPVARAHWTVASALLASACGLSAETFSWFRGVDGSFNDPNSWFLGLEATYENGKVKDPNPNKKLPGGADRIGFTRESDAFLPASYTVNITGGSVDSIAIGPYGLPAFTQPLTLNLSGTLTANLVEIQALITLQGSGELSGGKGSRLSDVSVLDETTLRISGGSLSQVTLEGGSAAILTDVEITAPALKPTEGLTVMDSTVETRGKNRVGHANLTAGSSWQDGGGGLEGNFLLEGGSLFQSSGDVTFGRLELKESSSFTAGNLSNPGPGLTVSGSGLFANRAILQGSLELFPREIRDDSKVEFASMELEQGFLRISGGSKLKNGNAILGAGSSSAGIHVDGPGSTWEVTNDVENAYVRISSGGLTTFGRAATKLSARVAGEGSELRFDTVFNGSSLTVDDRAIVRGRNLNITRGGGSSSRKSEIRIGEAFNFGLGASASFEIGDGGSLFCDTSAMGVDEGGAAYMTVTGAESLWRIRKELTFGEYPGTASLQIHQGGQVLVGPELFPTGSFTLGAGGSPFGFSTQTPSSIPDSSRKRCWANHRASRGNRPTSGSLAAARSMQGSSRLGIRAKPVCRSRGLEVPSEFPTRSF